MPRSPTGSDTLFLGQAAVLSASAAAGSFLEAECAAKGELLDLCMCSCAKAGLG